MERPSHPDLKLHSMFVQNIQVLLQNIKHSKADQDDNLYNFFSQFIQASIGMDDCFKSMVMRMIYTDYSHMSARQAAAHVIKSTDVEWPDAFLIHRIYLSDIRNQVVFEFWCNFQHVIPAQWMPEPYGTVEQNQDYRKALNPTGSRMLDPKDSERISMLLQWIHFLKLIHYVKNNIDNINYDHHGLSTCCGSWLYFYNKHDMTRLIWELFLDVWYYDKA